METHLSIQGGRECEERHGFKCELKGVLEGVMGYWWMVDGVHIYNIQMASKMTHNNYPRQDPDSEQMEQLDNDNSFEGENKIYELKSQIHSLQIQKNKLALQNQAIQGALENRVQQLKHEIAIVRRQNNQSNAQLLQVQDQNQSLKRMRSELQQQLTLIQSDHRKQAQATTTLHNNLQRDRSDMEKQLSRLRKVIEDCKFKDTNVKRDYEALLQVKEEIIHKLGKQVEEDGKKGDKRDSQLGLKSRECQDLSAQLQQAKIEIEDLTFKLNQSVREMGRLKKDYKRREETALAEFQNDRNQIIKNFNDKMKKTIKEKDSRIGTLQERQGQLESELMITSQQLSKQKSENSLLLKFNNYLQTSIKDYYDNREKATLDLMGRDKQLNQLKQLHMLEVAEIRKEFLIEKQALQTRRDEVEREAQELTRCLDWERDQVNQLRLREERLSKDKQVLQTQNNKLLSEIESLSVRFKEGLTRAPTPSSQSLEESKRPVEQFLQMKEELQQCALESEKRRIKIQQKEAQIYSLIQQGKRLEKDLGRAKTQLQSLEKRLREKSEQAKDFSHQILEMREQHERQTKQLNAKIYQLSDQVEEEKKKNDKKRRLIEEAENKCETLARESRAKVELLENRIDEFENKVSIQIAHNKNLNEEIVVLRRENQSLRNGQNKVQDEQSLLRSEKEKIKEALLISEQTISNLQGKIRTLEETERKLSQQILRLKKQISELTEEKQKLFEKVGKEEERSVALVVRAETSKKETEQLNERFFWLSKEKNRLREELETVYGQLRKQVTVPLSQKERSATVNPPSVEVKVSSLSEYPKYMHERVPSLKALNEASVFSKSILKPNNF